MTEAALSARGVPVIFDRTAGEAALRRAGRIGPADFLLRRAADDLDERLAAITRSFDLIADIGTPTPLFAERLQAGRGTEEGTGVTVLRVAPPGAVASGGGLQSIIGEPERLPLRPGCFDLAVSGMALHRVDDLPGALVQIRQALRPDGLFLACLAGGETLKELREALAAAEAEITGGLSPRIFPFADIRDCGALLQRAGFALPVVDSESVTVRYASAFALMRDLRAMGAVNTLVARRRAPTRRTVFFRAAEIYAERFSDGDGRVRATFETLWLSGWAPHESQQKPLKPGSAQKSLAEALRRG